MMHPLSILAVVLIALVTLVHGGCPFSHSEATSENAKLHLERAVEGILTGSDEQTWRRSVDGATDPLQVMNMMMQAQYNQNTQLLARRAVQNGEPLVLIMGSQIGLVHGDRRRGAGSSSFAVEWEDLTPTLFTDLKLVSHVGLASVVFAEGVIANGSVVDDAAAAAIQSYFDRIHEARLSLRYRNFTAEQYARSIEILEICEDFLSQMLQQRSVTEADVQQFGLRVEPPTTGHITDAAIAQLNMAHGIMLKWRSMLSDDEWNSMRVVIVSGSHMARNLAWAVQYFAALLNTDMTSGERIIYAEAIDLENSLELLGVHLLDFEVGQAYWEDPEHMHSDILAPATELYVPWLLQQAPIPDEMLRELLQQS